MAIIYRSIKGTSLTHAELDSNFRSFYFSSSLQENGAVLRLHRDDIAGIDHQDINLTGAQTNITILNQTDNRVTTATSNNNELNAESGLTYDGSTLGVSGVIDLANSDGNLLIGSQAGASISGSATNIVAVGEKAAKHNSGGFIVAVGECALTTAEGVAYSVAVGDGALSTVTSGNSNTAIGANAGFRLTSGASNIYIGHNAGPVGNTSQSNKLYINTGASDTPLILGDFSTKQIEFSGGVTGSSFTGSFVGDGSNLTNLSFTTEWDGSRSGSAEITGSFTVSGSTQVPSTVDFTSTTAISGSTFSGSFVGDGSGLTGLPSATGFPFTGSAIISGSLSVIDRLIITGSHQTPIQPALTISGSFDHIYFPGLGMIDHTRLPLEVKGPVRLDRVVIHSPTTDSGGCSFGIGQGSLLRNRSGSNNYAIGVGALSQQPSNSSHRNNIAIGRDTGKTAKDANTIVGNYAARHGRFRQATAIGYKAMGFQTAPSGSHQNNTAVGAWSSYKMKEKHNNTSVGSYSLQQLVVGGCNTAIGSLSLSLLQFGGSGPGGCCNTALGFRSGRGLIEGNNNVYIGSSAGPTATFSTQCNQLYIGNSSGEDVLIRGDFSTGQLTINNQVSASAFSGSFFGNGSGLTNVEWDGSRNGDAEVTGSFTVSGSSVIADFTNTSAVSGSIFSGSFVGNGAGLTGITGVEWDGSRNGDSNITGSLIVSGGLDVSSTLTLASVGYPGGPGVELIHVHSGSLSGNKVVRTFAIHSSTGYTGIKADYSISNSDESEKKIGTLYGSWDTDGNATINDAHTVAQGAINTTAFSIDASSQTSAILKLNAGSGNYDLNMLITAFKRQV